MLARGRTSDTEALSICTVRKFSESAVHRAVASDSRRQVGEPALLTRSGASGVVQRDPTCTGDALSSCPAPESTHLDTSCELPLDAGTERRRVFELENAPEASHEAKLSAGRVLASAVVGFWAYNSPF